MHSSKQYFISLHFTIIMMDVSNFFSLSSIASLCDDSDDEEVITAVGGAITFVAAYQQSQHVSDVMDQNHAQGIADGFFALLGKNLIIREPIMPSCWITCTQMLFMVQNLN